MLFPSAGSGAASNAGMATARASAHRTGKGEYRPSEQSPNGDAHYVGSRAGDLLRSDGNRKEPRGLQKMIVQVVDIVRSVDIVI